MKFPVITVLVFIYMLSILSAGYKAKSIQLQPARKYPSGQDFQNIVIGAHIYETKEKTLELFDTKKLHDKQALPVLIVVENNNNFAIQIHEENIFMVGVDEINIPTVPYFKILAHITSKNPLPLFSTKPEEILVRHKVNQKMMDDFEKKSFGEKILGPQSSDYGILFLAS